jgi:protein-S-isoprenylcysteine O-methyltransferase Ste14
LDDQPYNKTLATLRLVALFVAVGALLWIARPTPLSVYLGFVFVVAGECIRFWAAGYLRKTQELQTAGPYRYTRNPLYFGRFLIFTGIAIMAWLPYGLNLVVLLAGWIGFFGYYMPRKERVEPDRLRKLHGDVYERYFRAVPALFPTLTPYPVSASGGWSSDRMLRNREHYMVIGLLAISVFLLWRAHSLR